MSLLVRAAVLMIGAVVIAACARERTRAEIEAEDAKAGVLRGDPGSRAAASNGTAGPTGSWAPPPVDLPDGPGELRTLAALDDSVRRFPGEPHVSGWLYAAGAEGVKNAFIGTLTPNDSAYLVALPHAYELRESAGVMYTGWHLFQLVRRFPGDSLVDDAAFLIARRRDFRASDCEGHLDCDLNTSLGPWTDFLSAHPTSPLVTRALAESDTALRYYFDGFEPRHARYLAADSLERADDPPRVDAGRVEAVLAAFESALSSLPAAERERGLAILAPIRERWKRIKESLTAAQPSSP